MYFLYNINEKSSKKISRSSLLFRQSRERAASVRQIPSDFVIVHQTSRFVFAYILLVERTKYSAKHFCGTNLVEFHRYSYLLCETVFLFRCKINSIIFAYIFISFVCCTLYCNVFGISSFVFTCAGCKKANNLARLPAESQRVVYRTRCVLRCDSDLSFVPREIYFLHLAGSVLDFKLHWYAVILLLSQSYLEI